MADLAAPFPGDSDLARRMLVRLGDALRTIADPIEIRVATSRILGEHLGISGACYFSVERDAGRHVFVVDRDFHRGPGAPSLIGRYPRAAFGEAVLADLERGRTVVVPDVDRLSLLTESERQAYHAVGTRSFVAVPLIMNGENVAGFVAVHSSPREWSPTDVGLIEETADRTWAAADRARAEVVRDSETTSFSLLEVQFDDDGAAGDVIVRDANPAQDRVDAIRGLIGSRTRGVLPHLERRWIERYAAVARTGAPAHFDGWCEANQRWYEVDAWRLGDSGSTLVATVYTDVTKRKWHERRQALLAEITQALTSIRSVSDTLARLAEMIGKFFDAGSCTLAEARHDREMTVSSYTWSADKHLPVTETRPLREFLDENDLATPLSGQPVVLNDTASDTRTKGKGYEARGVRSLVVVPISESGSWQFQLSVIDDKPRAWDEDDVALLREATGRVWSSVVTVRGQQALRKSEGRQAFLLELSDAVRLLAEPESVTTTACRLLGRHLNATRVVFDEVSPESHEDQSIGEADRASLAAIGARAELAVDVVKRGEIVACLTVHHAGPRTWGADDIALVQDVAERTWDAIQRARALKTLMGREDQLRRVNEQLEERAAARTSQIQLLFARLIEAQESERRRFARDLHDQLGQHMTALRMHLEVLQAAAEGNQALAEQTGVAQQLASELDDGIDFLTWQLRPAALDEFGLAAALHHLVTSWSDRFGVAATFDLISDQGRQLEPDAEMNLYRIAQEALHNIVKHANATAVTVQLHRDPGLVLLAIHDNGRGFDDTLNGLGDGAALGLISMRERATLAGGRLEVQSTPEAGTSIVVRVLRGATV